MKPIAEEIIDEEFIEIVGAREHTSKISILLFRVINWLLLPGLAEVENLRLLLIQFTPKGNAVILKPCQLMPGNFWVAWSAPM